MCTGGQDESGVGYPPNVPFTYLVGSWRESANFCGVLKDGSTACWGECSAIHAFC